MKMDKMENRHQELNMFYAVSGVLWFEFEYGEVQTFPDPLQFWNFIEGLSYQFPEVDLEARKEIFQEYAEQLYDSDEVNDFNYPESE